MKWQMTVTNHEEQAKQDREYWLSRTPEERLDAVELLRIEAGKFLHNYPAPMQKIVTITRKTPHAQDKVDVEESNQPYSR